MSLPAYVTVNGFQFRGTTAFARGWVDAEGAPISQTAPPAYPPTLASSLVDLIQASAGVAATQHDITADGDTTPLEAALAVLAREPLAYIAPLAAASSPFASLTVAADEFNLLNAKVTALLAALVAKGYMAAS